MGRVETRLTHEITDYLRSLQSAGVPIWWAKLHTGRYSQPGVPDLHITCRGRSVWIEIKTPQGAPTRLQTVTIGEIQQAGGVSAVVRSVEDVQDLLRGLI